MSYFNSYRDSQLSFPYDPNDPFGIKRQQAEALAHLQGYGQPVGQPFGFGVSGAQAPAPRAAGLPAPYQPNQPQSPFTPQLEQPGMPAWPRPPIPAPAPTDYHEFDVDPWELPENSRVPQRTKPKPGFPFDLNNLPSSLAELPSMTEQEVLEMDKDLRHALFGSNHASIIPAMIEIEKRGITRNVGTPKQSSSLGGAGAKGQQGLPPTNEEEVLGPPMDLYSDLFDPSIYAHAPAIIELHRGVTAGGHNKHKREEAKKKLRKEATKRKSRYVPRHDREEDRRRREDRDRERARRAGRNGSYAILLGEIQLPEVKS